MTDETFHWPHCPKNNRRNLLKISVLVEGGMLLAAIVLGLLLGVPYWTSARLDMVSVATGIVAGAVMLAAAAAVTESELPFAIQMRKDMDRLAGLFRGATRLDFLVISLLAGAGEEALFRGLLQTGAAAWVGLPAAILLSALAFGFAHFISRSYVAFTAVLGVVFSGLYVWSGNIVVPILAHATYDFIALCYVLQSAPAARKD